MVGVSLECRKARMAYTAASNEQATFKKESRPGPAGPALDQNISKINMIGFDCFGRPKGRH
jgi:hypothetical protein